MIESQTVFVVDDAPSTQELHAGILKKAGYEVETFSTGQAALRRLRDLKPVAVVTDHDMPLSAYNGLQLLAKIRNDYPDIGRIWVSNSSYISQESVQKAGGEAAQYLEKLKVAATPELLVKTLHHAIRAAQDEIAVSSPTVPDPKTAIIVDDEEAPRREYKIALEGAGFAVTEFTTVDKALEYLGFDAQKKTISKNFPTVVVTDFDTGRMSHTGAALMQALEGTRVGRVLTSGNPFAIKELQQEGTGGTPARTMKKSDFFPDLLIRLVNESIEAARGEQLQPPITTLNEMKMKVSGSDRTPDEHTVS